MNGADVAAIRARNSVTATHVIIVVLGDGSSMVGGSVEVAFVSGFMFLIFLGLSLHALEYNGEVHNQTGSAQSGTL